MFSKLYIYGKTFTPLFPLSILNIKSLPSPGNFALPEFDIYDLITAQAIAILDIILLTGNDFSHE